MRDWIDVTGWTLLHFVWQGALLGLAVAGVLWLFRRRSAKARYAVASGGLAALLAVPVVTAAVLWQAARAPDEVVVVEAEPRALLGFVGVEQGFPDPGEGGALRGGLSPAPQPMVPGSTPTRPPPVQPRADRRAPR